MEERLLLNLLLSMTPVFVYQLMMFHGYFQRENHRAQLYMGVLSGAASVLCMVFPIVEGPHFLWDLRWVPFLLAVLYGGLRGGLVCAGLLLGYRITVGGWVSCTIVAVDAVGLFIALMYIGRWTRLREKGRLIYANMLIALASYVFIMASVFVYFLIHHRESFFFHLGLVFFLEYGAITVVAHVTSVVLIENLFAEAQVRMQVDEAEKLHLISDLAASIAHEIRNPLTVAKGFVQLLGERNTTPHTEYVTLAVSELDRAEGIISDYLDFAKPQVEKAEAVSLQKAVQDIVNMMSPYAVMHQIRISTEVHGDVHIRCDARKFRQLVMNLVKNAIEAMPDGGVVAIRSQPMNGFVLISVRDEGVGMTDAQMQRLGKPFYSTKEKGTGLGLMVTFRLIEAMGGRLRFESARGKGTTAMIELPVCQVSTERFQAVR